MDRPYQSLWHFRKIFLHKFLQNFEASSENISSQKLGGIKWADMQSHFIRCDCMPDLRMILLYVVWLNEPVSCQLPIAICNDNIGHLELGGNAPPPSFQKCALRLDYMHVLYFRKRLGTRVSEMMFRRYIGNISAGGTHTWYLSTPSPTCRWRKNLPCGEISEFY